MRIAVYGGSFDPPHVGHAMVASWVRWTEQADQVWLMPVARHAFGKRSLPFERRVALCQALAETLGPWVQVTTIEALLPHPSYSLTALRALQEENPAHRFRLLLGADNLPHLDRWHRWDRIAAEFDPLVVGRAGYDSPAGAPVFPDISSTGVRQAIGDQQEPTGLVPAGVLRRLTADDRAFYSPGPVETMP